MRNDEQIPAFNLAKFSFPETGAEAFKEDVFAEVLDRTPKEEMPRA